MENGIRITTRNREGRYYKRIGETPPTNGGYEWDQSYKKNSFFKRKTRSDAHAPPRVRSFLFALRDHDRSGCERPCDVSWRSDRRETMTKLKCVSLECSRSL